MVKQSAYDRDELWRYGKDLVFKPGKYLVSARRKVTFRVCHTWLRDEEDLDLFAEDRQLIHAGTLLEKPDAYLGLGRGWNKLFVFLFDNYRTSCSYCSMKCC